MTEKKEKSSVLKSILTIVGNAVLVFLIIIGALIAFSMLPIKNNYQVLTVMSGSMKPTIPVGSVIVIKPVAEYKVDNIVTFKTPGSTKKKDFTTHRIKEIKGENGVVTYVTRGDANEDSDREYIEKDSILGKELFAVSLIGYLIGYIKTLPGLVLIIIVPAAIIIYEEVRKIHREAKDILAKRGSKKAEDKKINKKVNIKGRKRKAGRKK